MIWRIHYPGSVVVEGGPTSEEWNAAPEDGVQVVGVPEPYPDHPDGSPQRRWIGVEDRQLWTGEDVFDPTSESARREVPALYAVADETWKPKRGKLIRDAAYFRIWEEAAHGDR